MTSPPDTRRRLPPAERRALIVEAAGECFGRHGYDGTRLDDVAAAAGVTKPVLYRHFASKDALYLALLERHRADLGGFARAAPADAPPAERVRAVVEAWLDYVEEHGYAWRMLFRDGGGGPAIRAHRLRVQARARDVLAAMVGDLAGDRIPAREREALAELLRAGMASLVLWWIEGADVARDAVADAIVRVWQGVLDYP